MEKSLSSRTARNLEKPCTDKIDPVTVKSNLNDDTFHGPRRS